MTTKHPKLSLDKEKIICCTWRDDADCTNCKTKGQLDCKWDQKLLFRFFLVFFPLFIVAYSALIVAAIFIGDWWWLGVLTGYFAFFFIIETRILCSHCPYYSKEGIILHCLANHGFIKFYHYHPEPLSKFEKALLVFGFILFGSLPLGAQVYNIVVVALFPSSYSNTLFILLLVLLGISVVGIGFGFGFLFTRICPNCVNFSCPFNKVPKEIVDENSSDILQGFH